MSEGIDDALAKEISAAESLARIAWQYASASGRLMVRWSGSPSMVAGKDDHAAEVLRLLQSRIYFNVTRAAVGRALVAAGYSTRAADAQLSATRALDAVARARQALTQLCGAADDCETLLVLLDAIARELEARFPHLPPRRSWKETCR